MKHPWKWTEFDTSLGKPAPVTTKNIFKQADVFCATRSWWWKVASSECQRTDIRKMKRRGFNWSSSLFLPLFFFNLVSWDFSASHQPAPPTPSEQHHFSHFIRLSFLLSVNSQSRPQTFNPLAQLLQEICRSKSLRSREVTALPLAQTQIGQDSSLSPCQYPPKIPTALPGHFCHVMENCSSALYCWICL